MAGGNDEVDVTLARQLAWTLNLDPAAAQRPSPTLPPDPETAGAASFDVDAFVEQFEAAVDSAWAAPLDEQQTRYLKLVASFGRQRRLVGRLPPTASTLRFARLHVRHHAAFVPGSNTDWAELLAFVSLPTGPETLEFLVDCVECPDSFVVDALDVLFDQQDWAAASPHLARRLVPLLPALPPYPRHQALHMLSLGTWPDARASLQAALQGPSLAERILVLTHRHRNKVLDDALVLRLVEELSLRPPPLDTMRALARAYAYDHFLTTVITERPTPAVLDVLRRTISALRPWLSDWSAVDRRVAIKALAALEPATVLPRLDTLLSRADVEDRLTATLFLDWLPDALALPRLRRGAHDLSGLVATTAREKLDQRFPEEKAGPRGLGPFDALVDAESRPRALEWLRLVDDVADENTAHLAMLLGKAPDPAALAVLSLMLAAGYRSFSLRPDQDENAARDSWVQAIRACWPPALASRALLEIARLAHWQWSGRLAEALRKQPKSAFSKATVALALRWIDHPDRTRRHVAWNVLPPKQFTPAAVDRVLARLPTRDLTNFLSHLNDEPALLDRVHRFASGALDRALARTPPDFDAAADFHAALPWQEAKADLRFHDALLPHVERRVMGRAPITADERPLIHYLNLHERENYPTIVRWVTEAPFPNALVVFEETGGLSFKAHQRLEAALEGFLDGKRVEITTVEEAFRVGGAILEGFNTTLRGEKLVAALRERTPVAEHPDLHFDFVARAFSVGDRWHRFVDVVEDRDVDALEALMALPGLSKVPQFRELGALIASKKAGAELFTELLPRVVDPVALEWLHDWLDLGPVPNPSWRDDPRMPGEAEWAEEPATTTTGAE